MKKLRKNVGLTQKELADAVGCSRTSIVNIENGTYIPRYPLLKKIADVLKVDSDYLYDILKGK